MSRLLKIAIALLLVVFILAPGVTGFLVESSIEEAESGYGKAIEQGPFKMVNSSFERGWFSSDQSLELDLTDPQLAVVLHLIGGRDTLDELPRLAIETKATHGIIPLANPALGGLRPAVAQTESTLSLKYSDGEIVELPVKVYSSLGTGRWVRIMADPISAVAPDNRGEVNWDGADLSATLGNTTTYQGDIGALVFEGDGARLETTPMTIEGKFTKGDYAFSESESSMSVERLTLTPPASTQQDPIVVKNIRGTGSLELMGDRAVTVANLNIGGIDNATMAVDAIEIVTHYDVDAAALSEFIAANQKLQSQYTKDDDDLMAENARATFASMMQMLAGGAKLDLEKFNVTVDSETMKVNLNVDIPAGSNSPQAAMAGGQAAGNIVIPDAMVKTLSAVSPDIAGGLTMAAMMGFVQQKDGAYESRISYKDGILMLNDLPVPLPF